MASQLRDAAAVQGPADGQPVTEPALDAESEEDEQTPPERRSASGSAMQQLRSTGG
jgi:hypothetical protein